MNALGLYLIKESIGISDALEHIESDEVIAELKQKENLHIIC